MQHFEDFPVGEVIRFGSCAVTVEDIETFAREFDPGVLADGYPGHDAERGAPASAWHVCALMMRMICDAYVLEAASLGAPGIEHLEWEAPVYAGDTLSVQRTTLDARRSRSRPDLGLVHFRFEVFGHDGVRRLVGENWAMFATREAAA